MSSTRLMTPCIAALVGAAIALSGSSTNAAPEATAITPQLVDAAKREGKVVLYTAIDLVVAERIAKAFEAAYPGITVAIERTGGERIFQRIAQERANNIFAVDVVDASDQGLFITWKKLGVLDAFVPKELAAKWPAAQRDGDGFFGAERFTLMPIAYNTELVKAADAPKSFADLLDPKWAGKIVKAHPSYSGGIVTSTFQTARDLGWEYFEKLGKQRVMQVQSATDPPKKLALGERAVEADGLEYVLNLIKEKGDPVEIVYPTEGTPFIPGSAAIVNRPPHPNAARLFYSFLFSREAQQFLVDVGGMRSFHPDVSAKAARTPLSSIKLMRSDPETQEKETEAIKQKYSRYFGI
jgi:iron(III) transport system substrate-binding protein